MPEVKIYFHQTWAYETDSEHSGFISSNNDQKQMYNSVLQASEKASMLIDAQIIPVGGVVQFVRENVPEFDYANGGVSLCRDGFHLSYDYGRFLAAAVWLRTLTGINISVEKFEDFDASVLEKLLDVVNHSGFLS